MLMQVETTLRAELFQAGVLGLLGPGRLPLVPRAGFARARASASVCVLDAAVLLLLFHLQFLLLAFGLITSNMNLVWQLLTFFNLFVVLAAICAILGFVRLTNPR